MPNRRLLLVIPAIMLTSGCSLWSNIWSVDRPDSAGSVTPPAGIQSTIKYEGKTPPRGLNQTTMSEAPGVRIFSTLVVTNMRNDGSQLGDPEIKVSKSPTPLSDSEWEGRPFTLVGRGPNRMTVAVRNIPGRIDNRRYIKVVVPVRKNGQTVDSAVYHLQYVKRWRGWNGLSSPVLYRAVGNLGDFGLSNFSPSIAGGPRSYFGGGEHQFVGLNAMLTVYQSTENVDRPFSLGAGGIFDFGGWLQAGVNYHFKDRRGYFVIGVRPEVWKPQ